MGQEKSLPINSNPYDYCQQQKFKSKSLSGLEYCTKTPTISSQKSLKSLPANNHQHSTYSTEYSNCNYDKYQDYQSNYLKPRSYSPINRSPLPPPPACSTASKSSNSSGYSSSYCPSTESSKSRDKHKNYLSHHLYIKSYLDILEDDLRAKKNFQPARPGIRNYKPKIYNTDTQKKNNKNQEPELWI